MLPEMEEDMERTGKERNIMPQLLMEEQKTINLHRAIRRKTGVEYEIKRQIIFSVIARRSECATSFVTDLLFMRCLVKSEEHVNCILA